MKILISGDKTPKEIWVDDDIYIWASKYTWRTDYTGSPQATTKLKTGKTRNIKLSREIMGNPVGLLVDHIDHNTLNNLRINLRICTVSQNNMNRLRKKTGSSKYKGVWFHPGENRWYAHIRTEDKRSKSLGGYKTEIEAARAWNQNVFLYHGEFAVFNIL